MSGIDFKKKYEIGFPVFERLFNMDSNSLKELLQRICASHPDVSVLKEGSVKKEICDDRPQSITISYYSSFSITPFGINYKPEHGGGSTVVEFNEFFKLD